MTGMENYIRYIINSEIFGFDMLRNFQQDFSEFHTFKLIPGPELSHIAGDITHQDLLLKAASIQLLSTAMGCFPCTTR